MHMDHDGLLSSFKEMLEKQDLSESSITSYLQGINVFTTWALDFYQQEVSLLEITTNNISCLPRICFQDTKAQTGND